MKGENLQEDIKQPYVFAGQTTEQNVEKANREREIRALMDRYYELGLIGHKKIHGVDAKVYVKFSLALSRVVLSTLRGALLLFHGARHLSHSLPIAGAGLAIIGLAFALITLDYANITRTGIFNTIGLSLDALLNICSDIGTAITAFVPSVAQFFSWLPVLGFVSSGLMICMEIINIYLVEKKHDKILQEFDILAKEPAINPDQDKNWLVDSSELSFEQQLLKTALKEKVSIDVVLKHKNAIRKLFTKDEFDSIKKKLISHQSAERKKVVIRHILTLNIAILVAVASIIGALLPGLAVAMALVGIGMVIAAFVTKLVLYETILKEKSGVSLNDFFNITTKDDHSAQEAPSTQDTPSAQDTPVSAKQVADTVTSDTSNSDSTSLLHCETVSNKSAHNMIRFSTNSTVDCADVKTPSAVVSFEKLAHG